MKLSCGNSSKCTVRYDVHKNDNMDAFSFKKPADHQKHIKQDMNSRVPNYTEQHIFSNCFAQCLDGTNISWGENRCDLILIICTHFSKEKWLLNSSLWRCHGHFLFRKCVLIINKFYAMIVDPKELWPFWVLYFMHLSIFKWLQIIRLKDTIIVSLAASVNTNL